ncbi:aminoglycoside phosphotransferase [Nitrosomonas sp. HPC101]|uniref:aminoglycoside phosphotransferase family protein n=1 Tax=Nitrosomonas sp. HPC101 TaxID=1658667 RepID=UPI001367E225|nr:phosphotransferase [Nitrosomonas sp. HPC101]MXS85604.1 aminoglycoside phosphotransferase [Nitrosomonas sp. HPC101]
MNRLQLLQFWLKTLYPDQSFTLAPASADASFRRYFRISFPEHTLIAMDAPPQQEDCRPFLHAATVFSKASIHVPDIIAQNLEQGFLLLSDLGNTTYLQALNANPDHADPLYREAIDALIKIQRPSRKNVFPEYDRALLLHELALFPDWYMTNHLQSAPDNEQKNVLQLTFDQLLGNNLAQPQVFVHRDYHSRNLMIATPNPGVIDFQDAVFGPITYDLVSLFKDAYIQWEEAQVLDWTIHYWEQARHAGLPVTTDFSTFYRDFEFMGVQRHLKVLGVFSRLYYRDGKSAYLQDIPIVLHHLRQTCERYHELHLLARLLDQLEDRQPATGYTF